MVIKKVNRQHNGKYFCLATNLVGRGKSNDVLLTVDCKSHFNWVNLKIELIQKYKFHDILQITSDIKPVSHFSIPNKNIIIQIIFDSILHPTETI